MKLYPNSMYGYCEICRQTGIAVVVELEDGLELACPTCMDCDCEAADMESGVCSVLRCGGEAEELCRACKEPMCPIHSNKDGMCDGCSPSINGSRFSHY
jgi:hypothetical protein